MMGRVRSSWSTSGGVEVARRGVARRLQPTPSTDLIYATEISNLYPLYPIYVVRRRWRRVKEMFRKVINFKRGVGANRQGASPVGRGIVKSWLDSVGRRRPGEQRRGTAKCAGATREGENRVKLGASWAIPNPTLGTEPARAGNLVNVGGAGEDGVVIPRHRTGHDGARFPSGIFFREDV